MPLSRFRTGAATNFIMAHRRPIRVTRHPRDCARATSTSATCTSTRSRLRRAIFADDRSRGDQSLWLSWGEALCRKDDGEHESFGIPDLLHHGAQAAERRLLQLAAKAGMVWRTCHRRASALNPFEQQCLALTFQFDRKAPVSRG